MTTITISDEKYNHLLQHAKTLNTSPESLVELLLDTFLSNITPFIKANAHSPSAKIQTLGDLLTHGAGLWANQDDIEDVTVYAHQLRQKTWQRVR